jgi:hypothetical protein
MDRETALKAIRENNCHHILIIPLRLRALAWRRFDPNSKKAISESNLLKELCGIIS